MTLPRYITDFMTDSDKIKWLQERIKDLETEKGLLSTTKYRKEVAKLEIDCFCAELRILELKQVDYPWNLIIIPKSIFKLKKGEIFRWYQSWTMPMFSFEKIEKGRIISRDSKGKIFTWSLKGSETIFINKNN